MCSDRDFRRAVPENGGADRRPGRRRCRGRTFQKKKKKKSEVRLACLGLAKGKERARRIDRRIAREPPADPFPGARAPIRRAARVVGAPYRTLHRIKWLCYAYGRLLFCFKNASVFFLQARVD